MAFRVISSVLVCCLALGWASGVRASTWTDYLDEARDLVAEDSERLNLQIQPTQAGEVKLSLEVRQTGEISKAKVITSSGVEALDTAALASLQQLSALPTPPASVYFKQFFTPLTVVYVFDPTLRPEPEPVVPVEAEEIVAEEPEPETPGARVSEVVAGLQAELIEAGYDPGPIDGLFGRGTEAAIQAYQRERGLAEDGVPTADLLREMKAFNQEGPALSTSTVAVSEPIETAAANADVAAQAQAPAASEAEKDNNFTPPASGSFSLNREIVEDYEYIEDRVIDDYSSF